MSFITLIGMKVAECEPDCMTSNNRFISALGLDLAIVITSIVLAALGLNGVIGFPPAACYALFGVASLLLLADGGLIIGGLCLRDQNNQTSD